MRCSCAAQAKASPATQAAAAVQAVSLGPSDATATGPADKPDTLIGKWQLVSGVGRMPSDTVLLQHCTPCLHSIMWAPCLAGRVDVRVGSMVQDWVMQHELVLTDRRKRRMANVQVRSLHKWKFSSSVRCRAGTLVPMSELP